MPGELGLATGLCQLCASPVPRCHRGGHTQGAAHPPPAVGCAYRTPRNLFCFFFFLGELMNIFIARINEGLLWREPSQPWPCTRAQQLCRALFGKLADATGCATTFSRAFHSHLSPRRSQGTFPASGAFLALPAALHPRHHRLCIPRDLPAPPWQLQAQLGAQHQGHSGARVCQHLPGHCQPWEAFP